MMKKNLLRKERPAAYNPSPSRDENIVHIAIAAILSIVIYGVTKLWRKLFRK